MSDVICQADQECKALWEGLTLNYPQVNGHPLLLKEIALFHGMQYEDGMINVASGQECIHLAMHAIVEYLHQLVICINNINFPN